MADPLSISASIAGLIGIAEPIFRSVYKAVKDAKNDVEALATEINELSSHLRHLKALALILEAEGNAFDPLLRHHYLYHCKATLDKMSGRLKKAQDSFASSKLKSTTRQLKWPFSASETKDLLQELSRHKGTIQLALSTDTMHKIQLALSKVGHLDTEIKGIQTAVNKIEINTKIIVKDEVRKILDYFMKYSPQPDLEMSIKLRHAMTGLWLTESHEFRHWLDTPGSTLWLSGIPGAGKTVLSGSVVQEALARSYADPEVCVGFFFCDYKNPNTWRDSNILGAIAAQLAQQKKEAFDILHDYYNELQPGGRLEKMPNAEELRTRIGKMAELFRQ